VDPILLYAAAFWLTDAVRDSGLGGITGEAADVVEEVGVAAEMGVAGVAAVAPGRSHGFGGEAMASNAGRERAQRWIEKFDSVGAVGGSVQVGTNKDWDWSEGRMRRDGGPGCAVPYCRFVVGRCVVVLDLFCPVRWATRGARLRENQASSISKIAVQSLG
jgi:hypothetical protein